MKERMSISDFVRRIDISRATLYRWLSRYIDELMEKGLIEVKRHGAARRVYVTDEKGIIEFFRRKGVFLKEEDVKEEE